MVTNSLIKECMQCLVGWKESAAAGTCYDALTDHLKHSDSEVYVNDLPAVKLEIINDMLGKDQDVVNSYLTELYNDTSIKVIRSFVQAHKKFNYTKALLENYDLGIGATNIRTTQTKRDRFVGFEIIPKGGNSVNAQVMQIGGMFSQAQAVLPIYFYCSTQLEPLLTFNASTVANSLTWFDLSVVTSGSGSGSDDCDTLVEIIAKYINKEQGSGAKYYIGYYESELDANNYAIQTSAACLGGCSKSSKTMNVYATVRPCEVPSGNTYVGRELFDLTAVGWGSETKGLHIKMNVTCDISQIICDNRMLFAECHRLQQAITVLWDCYNSTALNKNMGSKKEDFKMMAEKYELDLMENLKSLTVDFSNVDPICVGSKKGVFGLMNI